MFDLPTQNKTKIHLNKRYKTIILTNKISFD